jgi:hypothetical protein
MRRLSQACRICFNINLTDSNWESAAETTVGAAVFVGALGLYLSAGSVLAAAGASLAALAIAPMFRVKSRRLPMLAVSILCLGMYI